MFTTDGGNPRVIAGVLAIGLVMMLMPSPSSAQVQREVMILRDGGACVTANGWCGMTPLIYAVKTGLLWRVKQLLDHGANVNGQDYNGFTAVSWAGDDVEIAKLLEERGGTKKPLGPLYPKANYVKCPPVLGPVPMGQPPPQPIRFDMPKRSAHIPDPGHIRKLIPGHCFIRTKTTPELSPVLRLGRRIALFFRVQKGSMWEWSTRFSPQQVRTLIPRKQAHLGFFLQAVRDGDLELIQSLLTSGADINARDRYGVTPLILAVKAGRLSVVNVLLDKGADVNAADRNHLTALSWAHKERSLEIAKLLEERGGTKKPLGPLYPKANYVKCPPVLGPVPMGQPPPLHPVPRHIGERP